jgi:hypothetical protein
MHEIASLQSRALTAFVPKRKERRLKPGGGPGAGKILNIPMAPGAGDAEFLNVCETRLVPAGRQFKPDFILISAGFDSYRLDGKTIHYEFTAMYDGKDYPVKGDPVRDAVSIRKVDDYNFDVTNKKGGKAVNTVRAAYARDGKSRTMTTTAVNANGEKTTTSTVWDRQ